VSAIGNRPATVTVVSWLVMLFSAVVVATFLARVSTFDSYEITSVSLVAWWFVLGLFPLYFLSGFFMLWAKDWARQLCLAVGTSSVLFGVVALPFATVMATAGLFVVATAVLLYRPQANAFFIRAHGTYRRLSVASLLIGALSAGMAASVAYLRSVHVPGSGESLRWLTKMGLVKHSSSSEPSITEASMFAVNDENALLLLTSLAIVLAVAAMALALVAEYRREPTLYLSAGYVCGALALLLFKPVVGFATMVGGIVAIMVIRHDRRTHEDA
jgi:hypothetical protein